MPQTFQPETLTFLRGLAKHNDRDWFEARRPVFERAVKAPMLAVIEEINQPLESFAPEHVRPAHKIMMRIYRDIRFSKDKRPYKHHASAWWSRRGMEKTSGGGFYLQISATEVLIAAGVYMPERDQLLAVRRWMAENHATYRKLLRTAAKPFANSQAEAISLTAVEPAALTRMPKGFPADHLADELLRAKNWGVQATLPASAALKPDFVATIVKLMRRANPIVAALNGAILATQAAGQPGTRKPLF